MLSFFKKNPFTPTNDPLRHLYPNAKIAIGKSPTNPYGVTLGPDGMFHHNGSGGTMSSAVENINFGNESDDSSDDSRDGSPSGSPDSSPVWTDSNGSTWNTYDYMSNGSIGSSSAKSWDYLNADLARQYGMSRETAYQEALSNTGYQRSVADMQAAGLNPSAIFGAGSGYQASGVGYVSASTPSSGGSGYVAQTGVSRRGTSAKAQSDYNLTGKQYALIQLLGAGVGAMVTHSFSGALSGAAIGRYVAQYIGNK